MKNLFLTCLAGIILVSGCSQSDNNSKFKVRPSTDIKQLSQFDLKQVRLLDSPFKEAMQKDQEYLLSLEPDRLLAPYWKQAGVEPEADNYGGWENTGLDGHSLGHYLTALSMMYASTDRQEFKDRADYIVDELSAAQDSIGTGYISGVPEGKRIFSEIASGQVEAAPFDLNGGWVPWYNMHKLYAGLRDAYLYTDNKKAKQALVGLSDWAVNLSDKLTEAQFDSMTVAEYGGMNEVLADVYAFTGDEKYLDVAKRFNDPRVFPPLVRGEDELAGLHANTQIPKIIGAARQYELTGKDSLRQIATFFWDTVVENRTYANGGNSEDEHFGKLGTLDERLTKYNSESCNTYNMLKLTEYLMKWYPEEPKYAEYYENALYNHILASQDPKTGMFCYFMPLVSGHFKTFSSPENSFWCCVGSGMENHTKYGKNIYLHNDSELYVNLFIPSEVQWEAKGVKLVQNTDFPNAEQSKFTVRTDQPVEFTLNIRRPSWASGDFKGVVDGDTLTVPASANYMRIERTWENGDQVNVSLPMHFKKETIGDNPNLAAIKYGPILLAGKLGTESMDKEPIPYAGYDGFDGRWDHRRFEDLPTVSAPRLDVGNAAVNEWMSRQSSESLMFKTDGVGEPRDVEMEPYYRVNHQRYAIYWDFD